MRHADVLLRDAGWIIRDGRRVRAATGAALTLDYVGTSTGVERAIPAWVAVLEDLGIDLRMRLHDFATVRYEFLNHNFDISQSVFSPRFRPGGAERLGWHSENRDVVGYALAGASDPALDAAIEAIARATTISAIDRGTRAFDRVLRWQHYVVPLWYRDEIWLAHDADLRLLDGFALKRFGHLSTLWWAWSKMRRFSLPRQGCGCWRPCQSGLARDAGNIPSPWSTSCFSAPQ